MASLFAWVMYPRPKQTLNVYSPIENPKKFTQWRFEDANEEFIVLIEDKVYAWGETDLSHRYRFIDRSSGIQTEVQFPMLFNWEGFTNDGRYFGVEYPQEDDGQCFLFYVDPRTGKTSEKHVELWNGSTESWLERTFAGFSQEANTLSFAISDRKSGLIVKSIDINNGQVTQKLSFPDRFGPIERKTDVFPAEIRIAARGMAVSPDGELFAMGPAWNGDQRTTEPGISVYNIHSGQLEFRVTDFFQPVQMDGISVPFPKSQQSFSQTGVANIRFSDDGRELSFSTISRPMPDESSFRSQFGIRFEANQRLYCSLETHEIRRPAWSKTALIKNSIRNFKSAGDDWVLIDNPGPIISQSVLNGTSSGVESPKLFNVSHSLLMVRDKKTGELIQPLREFKEAESDLRWIPGTTTVMYVKNEESFAGKIVRYAKPYLKRTSLKIAEPEKSYAIICYDWKTKQFKKTTTVEEPSSKFQTKNGELFACYTSLEWNMTWNGNGEIVDDNDSRIEVWSLPLRRWRLEWVACLWVVALIVCYCRFRRPTTAIVAAASKQELVT